MILELRALCGALGSRTGELFVQIQLNLSRTFGIYEFLNNKTTQTPENYVTLVFFELKVSIGSKVDM